MPCGRLWSDAELAELDDFLKECNKRGLSHSRPSFLELVNVSTKPFLHARGINSAMSKIASLKRTLSKNQGATICIPQKVVDAPEASKQDSENEDIEPAQPIPPLKRPKHMLTKKLPPKNVDKKGKPSTKPYCESDCVWGHDFWGLPLWEWICDGYYHLLWRMDGKTQEIVVRGIDSKTVKVLFKSHRPTTEELLKTFGEHWVFPSASEWMLGKEFGPNIVTCSATLDLERPITYNDYSRECVGNYVLI